MKLNESNCFEESIAFVIENILMENFIFSPEYSRLKKIVSKFKILFIILSLNTLCLYLQPFLSYTLTYIQFRFLHPTYILTNILYTYIYHILQIHTYKIEFPIHMLHITFLFQLIKTMCVNRFLVLHGLIRGIKIY